MEIRNRSWVDFMDKELQQLSPLSNWRIWKIPESLLNVNEDAYRPRIISIGPLHHGSPDLQFMEGHKLSYTISFLKRTPNTTDALNRFAEVMQGFDKKVRDCYAEKFQCTQPDLAKMLIVDGCFILELFLRCSMDDLRKEDDPIFNTPWMILALQHDLILLENQIPFFVLEWLFDLALSSSSIGQRALASTIPDLALAFFLSSIFYSTNKETFEVRRGQQFPHLLGLIHSCYLPGAPTDERRININIGGLIPLKHATSLREAGVLFQKNTENNNLFDMKFENRVLQIPPFHIRYHTETFFRNLIAYEQFFHGAAQWVTSYVCLMSHLITIDRDAELLANSGILENDLGGCEDTVLLFANMSKEIALNDFRYAGLSQDLNRYYMRRWSKYRANLNKYIQTPWVIISLIAVMLMLQFHLLRTLYAMLSYHHPNP